MRLQSFEKPGCDRRLMWHVNSLSATFTVSFSYCVVISFKKKTDKLSLYQPGKIHCHLTSGTNSGDETLPVRHPLSKLGCVGSPINTVHTWKVRVLIIKKTPRATRKLAVMTAEFSMVY